MNKKALIIIDVQNGLFTKKISIFNSDTFLQNINNLESKARKSNTPIIYVQHDNKGFLLKGTESWELHPKLNPTKNNLFIYKNHGNAFKNTNLLEELKNREIDTLIITGLVSHGCVKATCLGAKELGFKIILVKDGHSVYHKEAEKIIADTNDKMKKAGIEITSTKIINM